MTSGERQPTIDELMAVVTQQTALAERHDRTIAAQQQMITQLLTASTTHESSFQRTGRPRRSLRLLLGTAVAVSLVMAASVVPATARISTAATAQLAPSPLVCLSCSLAGAQWDHTDLAHAYLFDDDLHGAALDGSDLSDSDLQSVNLRGATLTSANFMNAVMLEANISFATLSSTTATVTL